MVAKKEAENWAVKVFLVASGGITFEPLTEKDARAHAEEICTDGWCAKDDTYYPVSQILKVKVYQLP